MNIDLQQLEKTLRSLSWLHTVAQMTGSCTVNKEDMANIMIILDGAVREYAQLKPTIIDEICLRLKTKAFPEDGCGEYCVYVSDIEKIESELKAGVRWTHSESNR